MREAARRTAWVSGGSLLGDLDAEAMAHVKEQWKVLEPYTNGFYVNDLANETQAQIDANYGANLRRLVEVKNT